MEKEFDDKMKTQAKFFCENCGNEVKGNARFCPSCGKFFSSVKCPKCGHVGSSNEFKNGCPQCGYKVGSSNKEAVSSNDSSDKSITIKSKKQKKRSDDSLPVWIYLLATITLLIIIAVFIFLF